MRYGEIVRATFICRPNRFIAEVSVVGRQETVHVKNTGRCKELLIPGVEVILEKARKPDRRTKYDLIAVKKEGLGWVNIDSQAPNRAVAEWLEKQDYSLVKSEYTYGDSRIDFYMEKGDEKFLMEVKGCTQEIDGKGYFPDAPTERGVKHLRELAAAVSKGYHCILAFVIQMEGISTVYPNVDVHPEFGTALEEAQNAGVEVWYLPCRVRPGELEIL